MVSSLDIFGMILGIIYVIAAPFVAYFLFRKPLDLKLRDIALGIVGYFAVVVLNRKIVDPALVALIKAAPLEIHNANLWSFFENLFFHGALATQSDVVCFLLLLFFASQRKGRGPGFAYAIGYGGAFCILVGALSEFTHLERALAVNQYGAEAVFGVPVSAETLAGMFSYSLPMAAGLISWLLVLIGLLLLVWKGVVESKWRMVALAVLADLALFAPYLAMNVFLTPISRIRYDCFVGVCVVALVYWRRPILDWLARARLPTGAPGGLLELVATWRDEGGRKGGG